MFMEIVSERGRRISIEDLDTHHYENETFQQHAGAAESEPDRARQSRGVT
jgi:hypothetical protein